MSVKGRSKGEIISSKVSSKNFLQQQKKNYKMNTFGFTDGSPHAKKDHTKTKQHDYHVEEMNFP